MNLTELEPNEKTALIGLIAYMIDADGVVDDEEMEEVSRLAEEMDIADLAEQIDMARRLYPTREMMLKAAAKVSRESARELIRTVLFDVSTSDGKREQSESDLLDDVTQIWARP